MKKTGDWKKDFDWTDKNDCPVGEAVYPHLTEVDLSFENGSTPTLTLITKNTNKELN